MNITLFFTYGVSLRTWHKSGLLQREVRIYHKLMEKYGVEVQFLTYGGVDDREIESELHGIKLLPVYERLSRPRFKIIALLQSLFIPFYFRKEIKKTDILKSNQIWGGWTPVLAKWLFKKPLLVRCGYELYDFALKSDKNNFYKWFVYLISWMSYKSADRVHVATNQDKDFVIDRFKIKSSQIHVFPNWIDIKEYRPLKNVLNNKESILFVGRLNKQKNILLLLKALSGTRISLDIAGDESLKKTLEIEAIKLDVTVNFLGSIPNDKMPEIYNQYDIFVLCSKYEGNPKVLLEAMACGCSVVGTNVSGINNIIHNGVDGVLVEETAEDLRNGICTLRNNPVLRKHIMKNAREHIIVHHSLEAALDKEYSTYKILVS